MYEVCLKLGSKEWFSFKKNFEGIWPKGTQKGPKWVSSGSTKR